MPLGTRIIKEDMMVRHLLGTAAAVALLSGPTFAQDSEEGAEQGAMTVEQCAPTVTVTQTPPTVTVTMPQEEGDEPTVTVTQAAPEVTVENCAPKIMGPDGEEMQAEVTEAEAEVTINAAETAELSVERMGDGAEAEEPAEAEATAAEPATEEAAADEPAGAAATDTEEQPEAEQADTEPMAVDAEMAEPAAQDDAEAEPAEEPAAETTSEPEAEQPAIETLQAAGVRARRIGEVVAGSGIVRFAD